MLNVLWLEILAIWKNFVVVFYLYGGPQKQLKSWIQSHVQTAEYFCSP
jgi:hypothetical protein